MAVGGNRLDWFPIDGIELNTLAAGIRYQNREDLLLIRCAPETLIAGLWTRNHFPAAPVILAKAHQAKGGARYLLINSGNANAATGDAGLEDARRCCQAVADAEGKTSQWCCLSRRGLLASAYRLSAFKHRPNPYLQDWAPKPGWMPRARS